MTFWEPQLLSTLADRQSSAASDLWPWEATIVFKITIATMLFLILKFNFHFENHFDNVPLAKLEILIYLHLITQRDTPLECIY